LPIHEDADLIVEVTDLVVEVADLTND